MKLLDVIDGRCPSEPDGGPPLWIMRQAGRYLPEYREVRKRAGTFLDLCYTPDLATEVTLQPIRRFGLDAAILFSDILVIPDALGRDVAFEEGRGPVMTPLAPNDVGGLRTGDVLDHLTPVIETVRQLKRALPSDVPLIGFCGAPWTVATYMIAGHGTPDQAPARSFALEMPDAFAKLIDVLVDASADYLSAQLDAGADVVKIFDSWAGVLDGDQLDRWCVRPVARIVAKVRERHADARIIGFPKGAGCPEYRERTGVDVVALDWTVPLARAKAMQGEGPIQGLLDPMRLIVGGSALDEGVDRIRRELRDGPLIFNLGHGITPQTPIAHVERLVERVRRPLS